MKNNKKNALLTDGLKKLGFSLLLGALCLLLFLVLKTYLQTWIALVLIFFLIIPLAIFCKNKVSAWAFCIAGYLWATYLWIQHALSTPIGVSWYQSAASIHIMVAIHCLVYFIIKKSQSKGA